jgi:hypothetical protein
LLRGEVVEEEIFTQREKESNEKKKIEENKERNKEKRVWFEKNNEQLSLPLIIQCRFFFRYIIHILAEIGFWLSQYECFKINNFIFYFIY